MNLSTQSPFSSKASQLLSWGHWFTFANICLALVISLGYLFSDSSPKTGMGSIYMVLTWLGHIGFITFLSFVLTVFPLSLIFPYPRHIRGMAAVLATLGASTMAFDAYVYYNLGYHISSSALPQIISLIWHTISSSPVVATFLSGALVFIILSFELIVSNYSWKHLNKLKELTFGKFFTVILLFCFASSHLIHIWADANFKFDITKQDNILPLSYPTTAKSLLAKNNLLDLDVYEQAKSEKLKTTQSAYLLPKNLPQCGTQNRALTDILVFKNNAELTKFQQSFEIPLTELKLFLQPTSHQDAIFNLIYGLPAFYKKPILEQKVNPAWDTAENALFIDNLKDFQYITSNNQAPLRIVAADKDTIARPNSKHIIALALAEQQAIPAIVGSVFINDKKLTNANHLIQPMDLLATVINEYWQCDKLVAQSLIGKNIYQNNDDSGINYTQGVFIAYKKDKITLIEADGSYKNISAAQGFVLDKKFDVPFLVESIKELKRFIGK
ncbi:DUF3413 domain-containing protein [Pseudoalteromonas denitrificans]|uniref:Inner membrane protein YejM N-terminal domain-containing protein n=1 Tax=Pseudoalteromonas denitrificans DSM 6059 TaxID=1123010 RepID=A0A1I1PVZ4_9GAMM|nr:DUF3413 domain-containing protein [Pseudoalteromonas denitrificans]SFD13832.1 hypothetical protein SAMN02745724_03612 [Pseudoalteromonas denitrificans DSM 6059]